MADANYERISISTDPLNVLVDDIPPLSDDLIEKVRLGRTQRTQILDGSQLEQHAKLKPYAHTHVWMTFDSEDDIIRCVRMLQWSDERMRARTDPRILWGWEMSFREGNQVYFSVVWYTKEFFEERKDSYSDKAHSSYFSLFGMTPKDLKIKHEIVGE